MPILVLGIWKESINCLYQMVIWYIKWSFGILNGHFSIFCGYLAYFVVIWYILLPFGICSVPMCVWYIFPVFVFCTKKNLSGNPGANPTMARVPRCKNTINKGG
jgi:hypothetical protein